MRILVISDTHIPSQTKEIPSIIREEALNSDYCLHCGDFTCFSVFEKLNQWTKTIAVHGNMDDSRLRNALPAKRLIDLENVTVAMTHGSGHPQNIMHQIHNEFSKDISNIDMLIFGHSHAAIDIEQEGKIYFNPGSCTDTIFANSRTYGILNIQGRKIERTIVTIK
jgi:uncharacterized protein